MANEAVKVELYGNNNDGDVRRYTVADGTAISKGTLLTLSDPRTATGSPTLRGVFAGIANMDKEANDGSTSIGAWTNGVFDLKASGSITVGRKVCCAGHGNYVIAANQEDAGSYAIIVGTALETASTNEIINVRVLI